MCPICVLFSKYSNNIHLIQNIKTIENSMRRCRFDSICVWILIEWSAKAGRSGILVEQKVMREKELQFLMLCGPLEDAIDLIDAGKVESARALLARMLDRAKD